MRVKSWSRSRCLALVAGKIDSRATNHSESAEWLRQRAEKQKSLSELGPSCVRAQTKKKKNLEPLDNSQNI